MGNDPDFFVDRTNNLIELIRSWYPARIAAELCAVQPMTKEIIGDPTRGYDNIFTISYWSLMYEDKQEMMWEDDGGPCVS